MKSTAPAGLTRNEYSIGGVDTVVYSGGSGPPVVYFHGGGTFHGFEFTRQWSRQFHVVLPYHPGFGASADAPQLRTAEAYLAHYHALFNHLGLERFGLVGLSLGGALAARYAAAHNDRVERLVLGAPAGMFLPQHPLPDLSILGPREMMSLMVSDMSVLEPYVPVTAEENARFIADRAREGKSTVQIFQSGIAGPELEQSLSELHMPSLLLWGSEDRVLHISHADRWMDLLPHARLERLAGVGHLILDESAKACEITAAFLAGE